MWKGTIQTWLRMAQLSFSLFGCIPQYHFSDTFTGGGGGGWRCVGSSDFKENRKSDLINID